MKWGPFARIMDVCIKLNIHPILGIIPDNQDRKLQIEPARTDFWQLIQSYESRGAIIAQHGYQHVYNNHKTEFAGLPYTEQYEKIQRGKQILEEKLGPSPKWWMAPAHSLDEATCKALYELGFTYITDGIALYPYTEYGLTWVPQQLWSPRVMPIGVWTLCTHTNTISEDSLDSLLRFIEKHEPNFKDVSLTPKSSALTTPMRLAWKIALQLRSL